ncbi:MAG: bifunctional serine/threonine-protein kinase/formylglycine-generating enzyme family protein [Muribaculaceae bacterium]
MSENKTIHKYKSGDVFHDRYVLEKLIGVGGFADVWKATDKETKTVVALKIYTNLDEDGISDLSKEYTQMHGLNHTNILRAEHFDSWGNVPYLEMKFCNGGSLDKKIGKLTSEELLEAMRQILEGLKYLHENKIVHQDIKPANILIDNSNDKTTYLLSDFGISSKSKTKLSHSVNSANLGLSMTEQYAPPEKFSAKKEERRPSRKSDIFSFGISIFELVTGSLPFDDLSTGRQMYYNDIELDFSEIEDERIRKVVELCMLKDKESRPSAEELLKILESGEFPDVTSHPGKKTVRVGEAYGERQSTSGFSMSKLLIFLIVMFAMGGLAYFVVKNIIGSTESEPEKWQQKADTIYVNGIQLIMRQIPAGTFNLGCDDPNDKNADETERPAKQRKMGEFYMSQYEVTQELWDAVMSSNPSTYNNVKYPVNNVSWEDCQLFIEKLNRKTGLNFRLPTEAEWEYAAKTSPNADGTISSTVTRYSGGNTPALYAWYKDNSEGRPHKVGEKKPNAYGLYDMSGNVIEWCQDIYTNYSTGDPELDRSQRVLRGGYYSATKSSIRTTTRGSFNGTEAKECFGFRLCL